MSVFSKLFGGKKPAPTEESPRVPQLPTLKADPKRLTETVAADLAANIRKLPDFTPDQFKTVYEAATLAVQRGADLHVLFEAIMSLKATGMTKRRAGEIARRLWSQANALITQEKQLALGLKQAKWLYSGAPCISDYKNAHQVAQDKAHAAANGKKYDIAKGMFLNGKWTHPGREEGCKCASETFIGGFE